MNSVPQFSLRWNNYVSHVTGAFNSLRLENDLVDVTLCCEGKKIKAHKVLLSACSAYFKEIFKENPCQHPVIIFRNVKFDDLNAIINFMYHGEVSILQEQLESFLVTAELLEVKGLTDSTEDQDEHNKKTECTNNTDYSIDLSTGKTIEDIPYKFEEPINLAIQNPVSIPIPNMKTKLDIKNNTAEDKTLNKKSLDENNITTVNPSNMDEDMQIDSQNSVDLVDKGNSTESDLAKFRCQLCPKGFKHPTSLTLHKDSHAGKTQCPVCHRSFSRSYDMRSHLQKIHQGKQLTIKEIRYRSTTDVTVPKTFTHQM